MVKRLFPVFFGNKKGDTDMEIGPEQLLWLAAITIFLILLFKIVIPALRNALK